MEQSTFRRESINSSVIFASTRLRKQINPKNLVKNILPYLSEINLLDESTVQIIIRHDYEKKQKKKILTSGGIESKTPFGILEVA